ncbi:hypothetical protein B0T14DRAFT_589182 [Immersiella caudata]|uniref:Uncharacterized protein n=1 Tax=Immersiella caudata TaxID=314043 RepID=A0AA39WK49_9PEZI|nr:hypothetical protein B0T14DRAFT_589182 [Immersiella caudata]
MTGRRCGLWLRRKVFLFAPAPLSGPDNFHLHPDFCSSQAPFGVCSKRHNQASVERGDGGFGSFAHNLQGSVSSCLQGFWPDNNPASLISPNANLGIGGSSNSVQFAQYVPPRTLVPLVVYADISCLLFQNQPAPIPSDRIATIPLHTGANLSIPGGPFDQFNPVVAPPFPQPPLDWTMPWLPDMDVNFNLADLTSQDPYVFPHLQSPSDLADNDNECLLQTGLNHRTGPELNSPGPAPQADASNQGTESTDGSSTIADQSQSPEMSDASPTEPFACVRCGSTWSSNRRLRDATTSGSHVLMMAAQKHSARVLSWIDTSAITEEKRFPARTRDVGRYFGADAEKT